jgi:hypothetical protein
VNIKLKSPGQKRKEQLFYHEGGGNRFIENLRNTNCVTCRDRNFLAEVLIYKYNNYD